MLAGRPHEAVGNGSPRWMTVAPRERGTEPGLQADSPPVMSLTWEGMVTTFPGSVPVPSEPPRRSHRWPRAVSYSAVRRADGLGTGYGTRSLSRYASYLFGPGVPGRQ